MPVVIGLVKWPAVRRGFADEPAQSWLAALLVAVSMALQVSVIWHLASGAPRAAQWGRRVAVIHAVAALVVFVSAAFAKPIADSETFVTWYAGWFGPNPQLTVGLPSNPDGPWLGLTLLPALVLAQWALLRAESDRFAVRETWRGIAIACIAASALLGLWTFSPQLNGGPWLFFQDASSTFFNIGVVIHLIALWQIAVRSRLDWAWAGLIGFGCLISGLVLTRSGDVGRNPLPIGTTLEIGWYHLSPYLPPIAYALTAVAAAMLFKARPAAPSNSEAVSELAA